MVRACAWTITAQAAQLIQKLIGSSPSKWSRVAHCFLTLITTTALQVALVVEQYKSKAKPSLLRVYRTRDVNLDGFRIQFVSKYWDLQFKFKIWNVKFQIWVCHTEKIATLRCTKIEIN